MELDKNAVASLGGGFEVHHCRGKDSPFGGEQHGRQRISDSLQFQHVVGAQTLQELLGIKPTEVTNFKDWIRL